MEYANRNETTTRNGLFARGPMAAALAALLLATPMSATPAYADAAPASEATATPESAAATGTAANNPLLEEFSQAGTIEETVLVDEAGVKITATGLTYTDYAIELNLLIENNTDQDLEFLSNTLGYAINSINGIMVDDGYLSCDVAAGKKAKDTMSFSYDDLMLYGITEIADIEVGIYTSDGDWGTDDFYSGPRRIQTQLAGTYDYGTDVYQQAFTSKAMQEKYEYTVPSFKTDVLYDQAGVALVSEALAVNRDGEPALMLELVNNSAEIVRVETSDIYLNDLQVYGSGTWSGDSIAPGRKRIIDLRLSSLLNTAFWNAYGLGDVTSVSLMLGLENAAGDDMVEPLPLTVATSDAASSFNPNGFEIYNNGAGLRIMYRGLVDSPSSYGDDVYVLFSVENTSGQPVDAGIDTSSASVNGFMVDTYSWSARIPDGRTSAAVVQITGSSLKESDIDGAAGIADLALAFTFRDINYAPIDEPMITVTPEMMAAAGQDGGEAAPVDPAVAGDPTAGGEVVPAGEAASEAAAAEGQVADASAVTPEFKAMMDEYEAFMNGYVDFVITYTSSDDMLGMLTDYTNLVKQQVEWASKIEAVDQTTLSAADAAYYLEVTARISQRLLEIA